MTVGSKVKQTVASLKGAHATLAMYAQIIEQEKDKQIFHEATEQVEQVIDQLEERMKQLEFEEPQYKGF
jgi:preprotein translocase subunit SecD